MINIINEYTLLYNMKKLFFGITMAIVGLMLSCANATTPPQVKEITQDQFKTIVGDYTTGVMDFKQINKKPVVLDIYASWCGPCKRLAPILDELAKEYDGKVEFYKLDLDKNRELGDAFGVQSIPLVIFFPAEGKGSPQSIMGLHPKEDVKEVVDYMFFQKK